MNQQYNTNLKSDDDDGYCSRSSLDSPIQISKTDPNLRARVSIDTNETTNKVLPSSDDNYVLQPSPINSSSPPSPPGPPNCFLRIMLTRDDWGNQVANRQCDSEVFGGLSSNEILIDNNVNISDVSSTTYNLNSTIANKSIDIISSGTSCPQTDPKKIVRNKINNADANSSRKMIKLMPSSSSQNLLFYTRKSSLGGLVVSSNPMNNNPNNNSSNLSLIKDNTTYNSSILTTNNNVRPITSISNTLGRFQSVDSMDPPSVCQTTRCHINNGVIKTIGNNNSHLPVRNSANKNSSSCNANYNSSSARTSHPHNRGIKSNVSGNGGGNSCTNNPSSYNVQSSYNGNNTNTSRSCWYVGRHELHPVIDHDYCEFSTFNAEIQSGIILMSSETFARTDRMNLRRNNKTISVLNSNNDVEVSSDQQGKMQQSNKNASKYNNNNNNNNNHYFYNSKNNRSSFLCNNNNSVNRINNKDGGNKQLRASSSSSSLLSTKNSIGRPAKTSQQNVDKNQSKQTSSSFTSSGYDSSEDVINTSSQVLTEDKNYVKIPGSFQNDFVYFATTRGRSSRKRLADRNLNKSNNFSANYNRVHVNNIISDNNNNNNNGGDDNDDGLCGRNGPISENNSFINNNNSPMTTGTTSMKSAAINTFAWYKEMANTDKSSRFGNSSNGTMAEGVVKNITTNDGSSQQQQLATPDDSFNIEEMTHYLCSSSEDYINNGGNGSSNSSSSGSGNNNYCASKLLTSESDVVDLVMQMLPTSDLLLPDPSSFFDDNNNTTATTGPGMSYNIADPILQQHHHQDLFFNMASVVSSSSKNSNPMGETFNELTISTLDNNLNDNNNNNNSGVIVDNDEHCISNAYNDFVNQPPSRIIINGETAVAMVTDSDGVSDDDGSIQASKLLPNKNNSDLDFPSVTIPSELLDEINDNDLLITNDMPPCIKAFFNDLNNDSSITNHNSNDDNVDVVNHDNDDSKVDFIGCDIANDDDGINVVKCTNSDEKNEININDDGNDAGGDVNDNDAGGGDNDVSGNDKDEEDEDGNNVDVESDALFRQHELVLTGTPGESTLVMERGLPGNIETTTDSAGVVVGNDSFDQGLHYNFNYAQHCKSKNHQQQQQQQLEWPKDLSSCQLSPPLSSPSPSMMSSSSSSNLTPPELTSVNMYWNDLPGLLINGQEFVRLVDIHKQIMPAKDTGILKKRCTMLGLKFTSCTELQRDFLTRYMNAAKSKSKIIVSKTTALALISFYVNPKMRSTNENNRSQRSTYGNISRSSLDKGTDETIGKISRSVLRPSLNNSHSNIDRGKSCNHTLIANFNRNKNLKNDNNLMCSRNKRIPSESVTDGNDNNHIKRSARLQNKRISYLDMVNDCLSGTKTPTTPLPNSPLQQHLQSSGLNNNIYSNNNNKNNNRLSRNAWSSNKRILSSSSSSSITSPRNNRRININNNNNNSNTKLSLTSNLRHKIKISHNTKIGHAHKVRKSSIISYRPKFYTTSRGTIHRRRLSQDYDDDVVGSAGDGCNGGVVDHSAVAALVKEATSCSTSTTTVAADAATTANVTNTCIDTNTTTNTITNITTIKSTENMEQPVEHCYAKHSLSYYLKVGEGREGDDHGVVVVGGSGVVSKIGRSEDCATNCSDGGVVDIDSKNDKHHHLALDGAAGDSNDASKLGPQEIDGDNNRDVLLKDDVDNDDDDTISDDNDEDCDDDDDDDCIDKSHNDNDDVVKGGVVKTEHGNEPLPSSDGKEDHDVNAGCCFRESRRDRKGSFSNCSSNSNNNNSSSNDCSHSKTMSPSSRYSLRERSTSCNENKQPENNNNNNKETRTKLKIKRKSTCNNNSNNNKAHRGYSDDYSKVEIKKRRMNTLLKDQCWASRENSSSVVKNSSPNLGDSSGSRPCRQARRRFAVLKF